MFAGGGGRGAGGGGRRPAQESGVRASGIRIYHGGVYFPHGRSSSDHDSGDWHDVRRVPGAGAAGVGEDAGGRRRIGEPHDEQRRGDVRPVARVAVSDSSTRFVRRAMEPNCPAATPSARRAAGAGRNAAGRVPEPRARRPVSRSPSASRRWRPRCRIVDVGDECARRGAPVAWWIMLVATFAVDGVGRTRLLRAGMERDCGTARRT